MGADGVTESPRLVRFRARHAANPTKGSHPAGNPICPARDCQSARDRLLTTPPNPAGDPTTAADTRHRRLPRKARPIADRQVATLVAPRPSGPASRAIRNRSDTDDMEKLRKNTVKNILALSGVEC
ncbi:hypothetical protein RMCFA_6004 [Mycolicibacterium fortuitum subsp. acetamidolyticum]|uniref:Uncharacterized protein n=1 Tax=Mycolicibacterium fortuitum subsp. acetamidolyticum TaxID=144550 RepID=A0A100WWZ0_MYCFO|nr:hypothetical protein G155_00084 [Mycobacterium sp. VKM Ac-1817D]BDD97209.1 hypothetical protein MFTT_13030 [Mycolicibacterium fortuitum subsp. fortuitum]GAT05893.1 hypothetical protein RMCFA_6004 [Mycolicibacterium fortuitum subsp. acetamidolyticum]